ncbi:MAG: acyl carrier protein [Myxococcota bacterium]
MKREAEIIQAIQGILAQHLGLVRALEPSTRILGDLELDSLAQLTLVTEIENHFQLCFDEGDEVGLETVADLARLVVAKQEQARG